MLITLAVCVTATLVVLGCEPTNKVRFEFVYGGAADAPTFVAETSDPSVIASARSELAKPFGQRHSHINGEIARGDGGHNSPWSWHFKPDRWSLVEVSIELCDGDPNYIEENLDKWIAEIGQYCPWGSRISRER
jgi:hypothetical protein